MDILQTLNWRYAAKAMNGATVPQKKIDVILDSIRLSASSIGLQPYQVLVISNKDLLAQIRPIAMNQQQITEASHLLVFAAWDKVTNERVDQFIQHVAQTRNITEDSLAAIRGYLSSIVEQSAEDNFRWTARQAYIALGTALVAAASQQVDSTPMEGFNSAQLDELLGLQEKGLKSVVILPLGYRDETRDWLLPLEKVRTPKEQLFISDKELVTV